MINIHLITAFRFSSALLSAITANLLKILNAQMKIYVADRIGFFAGKTGFSDK
jgi:hypothetical protein